ncbi:MAG: MoaD/ThiS family protein [Candidatus Bathycorpusculaceae bacterium]
MTVTVKFLGGLRSASGKGSLAVQVEEAVSVSEVINKIAEELPRLRRALIDSQLENPRLNALILVNGKEISVLKGLETLVSDGDEVVLVPVTHGG